MTGKRKTRYWYGPLMAALVFAACGLFAASTASAKYMRDGSVPTGTGGWQLPTDFVCIVGVHMDGTLDIADGVTDRHTCQNLTKGTMNGGTPFDLKTMTSSAACTKAGGTGNDGAAHTWANSICGDSNGDGLSLAALDQSKAMCQAKGGTWVTSGKCSAYGAQFKGQDATGTPLAFGSTGTAQGAGTGYCYTVLNMTSAYGTQALCPSSGTVSTGFYDWSWGAETTRSPKCQSGMCCYAKGIAGYLPANLTKADGSTNSAGAFLDLSTFTTMGTCLANGGTWNNWTGQAASTTSVATTPSASTIPVWDYTTQAPDADDGCLHCHSSLAQYNGPAERQKDSYLMTGHKNMLRKVVAGQSWAGPDGVVYTQDTQGHAIDFTNGLVGGGPLYFIFGDWIAPVPNSIGPNGDTTTYTCGACHTTGFNDSTNPGVQSIGTPGYVAQQPMAPYDSNVAMVHKWGIEGINCSRCHNATVAPVVQGQISGGS